MLSDAWFRDLFLNLRSRGKSICSQKRYFRGSPFSQCFKLSPALNYFVTIMLKITLSNYQQCPLPLKTLDTIGRNVKDPVFSLGVSHQHKNMHNTTNLWKFWMKWSLKLQDNNERKIILVAQVFVLSDAEKGLQAWRRLILLSEKLPLSKKTCYFEGAVSQNVLWYQQLSVAHHQVSLYVNNSLG